MKKSILVLMCLASLGLVACNDENSNSGSKDDCGGCGVGKACVEISEGVGKTCVETCSTKDVAVKSCVVSENTAYTNSKICAFAADNETLIWTETESAVKCQFPACNANKTDCATEEEYNAQQNVNNGDCNSCGPNQVCVEVRAGAGKVCADTCPKKGDKVTTCIESNDGDMAYTNTSECVLAADNNTLVWGGGEGAVKCDLPVCNAEKNACATEAEAKAKLCFDEGESICEDDYSCEFAMVDGLVMPICATPSNGLCKSSDTSMKTCGIIEGKDALMTVDCYAGAGSNFGKVLSVVYGEACKDNEVCDGDNNGAAMCVTPQISEPDNPDNNDNDCGANFEASCGAGGATHSCIHGKVVDYTYPVGAVGVCHVFAEAQLATFVLESECSVLEMPKETCIDVAGYAAYTKQACGKAENGKYYWYTADAQECTNGCDADGKKCK